MNNFFYLPLSIFLSHSQDGHFTHLRLLLNPHTTCTVTRKPNLLSRKRTLITSLNFSLNVKLSRPLFSVLARLCVFLSIGSISSATYTLKILVSYNETFPTQACLLLRPLTSISSLFQQYSSWKENVFLLSIFSLRFHCLLQFSFCFFPSNGAIHTKVISIYFLMARLNFLISVFIVFDFEIIIQPPFCPWHCFKNCHIFYLVFNIILCIRCFIPYFIEKEAALLDTTNCFWIIFLS